MVKMLDSLPIVLVCKGNIGKPIFELELRSKIIDPIISTKERLMQ